MASSAPNFIFSLLLSVAVFASVVAADDSKIIDLPADHEFTTHLHFFFHENVGVTSAFAVNNNGGFSSLKVYDNALRATAESDSPVIGRAQGIGVYSDLGLADAGPTGRLTAMNLVFTAGEHNGSTLALMGLHRPRESVSERSIVGGSGRFHMARGVVHSRWVSPVGAATNVVEAEVYLTDGSGKSSEF